MPAYIRTVGQPPAPGFGKRYVLIDMDTYFALLDACKLANAAHAIEGIELEGATHAPGFFAHVGDVLENVWADAGPKKKAG